MPKTKSRIEEAIDLLKEELDQTVEDTESEESAPTGNDKLSALYDKEEGLRAGIYVLEQCNGWCESFGI